MSNKDILLKDESLHFSIHEKIGNIRIKIYSIKIRKDNMKDLEH